MLVKKILSTISLTLASISYACAGLYGDLQAGDNKATVKEKLNSSALVRPKANDNIFGNIGLDDSYQCKHKLAGLDFTLYFKWSGSGELLSVSLRSQQLSDEKAYQVELQTAWNDAVKLLSNSYGTAESALAYPGVELLSEGKIVISHIWRQKEDPKKPGKTMLGVGKQNDQYFLIIRFSDK